MNLALPSLYGGSLEITLTVLLNEQVPLLLSLAYRRGLHLSHGEQRQGDVEMGSWIQVILCRNLFLSVCFVCCQVVTWLKNSKLSEFNFLISRESWVPKLVNYNFVSHNIRVLSPQLGFPFAKLLRNFCVFLRIQFFQCWKVLYQNPKQIVSSKSLDNFSFGHAYFLKVDSSGIGYFLALFYLRLKRFQKFD